MENTVFAIDLAKSVFQFAVSHHPGRVSQERRLTRGQLLPREDACGIHTLNPLTEGDHGIFHAHISQPQFRRRGIAESSYPQACRPFLQRFDLRRILFKTPEQNVGAIPVKEKLGIRCVGEELVDFGIIRPGTLAKVFELTREEAGGR